MTEGDQSQPNNSQAPNAQQGPEGAVPSAAEAPGMPQMPTVPAEALQNPELQQQAMGNVK